MKALWAFIVLAACGVARQADAPEYAALGGVALCGDPAIRGEAAGDFAGDGACGIEDAVRVMSVAGVELSTPAFITCPTAQALKTWVEDGVRPAVGRTGGGVSTLRIVAHYSCRSRNNQAGARLSEHSFGRALDVAGIGLANGSELSVLNDWNSTENGARMRRIWQAACGPFGTVLGPESDRFHQDHFHLDTASYRSGSYCR